MKSRLVLFLALSLALTGVLAAEGTREKYINPELLQVQLIPSRDAAYLDAQRLPLQQMLEAQLKRRVNVTVATDYNALIEGMAAEQIHVGLLATTAYVLAADEGVAEAILTSLRFDVDDQGRQLRDRPLVASYKAQLVARADSGIRGVKDLRGNKIAIASFTSTSGFVWPANLLADNGLDPEKDVTWINVGGHDNAIMAVFNAQADAAFTFKDARSLFQRESFFPELMNRVVLVTNTSDIPNDTISVIPRLDPKLKEAVRQAFMNMVKDPKGLEIVRRIYNHEGYAPAKDSDYDLVRTYLARQKKWKF
ncbi:MAG TPA: phosphate/phosphite/phosphonate ABC transporter substrate-binding protein [Magnetospirillaceae bacterium]|nr:phosphate/phosphite/phosphonate ABC transporter substrate-binding protein [Magnetospirillaceae bacterium]